MLAVAHKLDALNENASVVALSYIGAQRTYPFYTDMADIKAMLESIARTFGYHYGKQKKVRINTISQSPTKTSAGNGIKGFSAHDYSASFSYRFKNPHIFFYFPRKLSIFSNGTIQVLCNNYSFFHKPNFFFRIFP